MEGLLLLFSGEMVVVAFGFMIVVIRVAGRFMIVDFEVLIEKIC